MHNIGVIYFKEGDYGKALEYYKKALGINEAIGNRHWTSNNLVGIGNIYNIQGDRKKAVEIFEKALKIYEDLGDKYSIAGTNTNIGDLS